MILNSKPSPIFLDEVYFRKIRKAENEMTLRLSQEQSALLLNWIGERLRNEKG